MFWKSDYDVCPECGSISECIHDTPPTSPVVTSNAVSQSIQPTNDVVEMVSTRYIAAGEEVYNTYGSQLTNAQLLARYGFILEGNEWDVISWSRGELPDETGDVQEENIGIISEAGNETGFVFWPGTADKELQNCVNGDAQISIGLLCWAVRRQGNTRSTQADALSRVIQMLKRVESLQESEEAFILDDNVSSLMLTSCYFTLMHTASLVISFYQ